MLQSMGMQRVGYDLATENNNKVAEKTGKIEREFSLIIK